MLFFVALFCNKNTNKKKRICCPRELSSTGKDIASYMQGPGFKFWPPPKKEANLLLMKKRINGKKRGTNH